MCAMKGRTSPAIEALTRQQRERALRGATFRKEWLHGQLVTVTVLPPVEQTPGGRTARPTIGSAVTVGQNLRKPGLS